MEAFKVTPNDMNNNIKLPDVGLVIIVSKCVSNKAVNPRKFGELCTGVQGAREPGVRGVRPHRHFLSRGCGAPPQL
jgi:hypothetical protein